jgi:hypothetical protein
MPLASEVLIAVVLELPNGLSAIATLHTFGELLVSQIAITPHTAPALLSAKVQPLSSKPVPSQIPIAAPPTFPAAAFLAKTRDFACSAPAVKLMAPPEVLQSGDPLSGAKPFCSASPCSTSIALSPFTRNKFPSC